MLGYKSVLLAEQKVSLSLEVAEERLQIMNSDEKLETPNYDHGMGGEVAPHQVMFRLISV